MKYFNHKFLIIFIVVLFLIAGYLIWGNYADRDFRGLYRDILICRADDNNSWDLLYGILHSEGRTYFFFLFYSDGKLSLKLIDIDEYPGEVINYSDSIEPDQYINSFTKSEEFVLNTSSLKLTIHRRENYYFYTEYEKDVNFFTGYDSIAPVEIQIKNPDIEMVLNGNAVRQMMQISKDLNISKYKEWMVFSSNEYDFLIWEYGHKKYGYVYNRLSHKFKKIDDFEIEKSEVSSILNYNAQVNFSPEIIFLSATVRRRISTISDPVIVSIMDVGRCSILDDENNMIFLTNCMALVENYEID